jgi:hypothetical protein
MPRYENLDWRGLKDFGPVRFHRLPKEFRAVRDLTLSGLWRSLEHQEI